LRTAFIKELIEQARSNPKVFLVVGDLGFSVVEPYVAEFPDRFLNAGVAEQNMTSVAAGLASEGYHVFSYSIANFPTLRCLEQIRNDVCYHNLPVTIVAVGGGMAYGNLGYSHHAVQDIGIMRTLPNITVLAPADAGEATECVRWLTANPSPTYLRLGKSSEPALHKCRGISSGPLKVVSGNLPVAIAATGAILSVALAVAKQLSKVGERVSVFSCPWLAPASSEMFVELANYDIVVSLEEHCRVGGLASLLTEVLPHSVEIIPFCVKSGLEDVVGSHDYLKLCSNLDSQHITERMRLLTANYTQCP